MRPVAFCIPGDIALPTGGYRYDRELLARLPALGVAVTHVPLPASFPSPTIADLKAAEAALVGGSGDRILLIDGLALGALPPAFVAELRSPLVALVHHPLGLETGLPPARAAALLANERAVLRHAARIIVTSSSTARYLAAEFGLPSGAITVAEPGVEPRDRAVGSGSPPRVLAVGAISARKAYDLLVRALAECGGEWRLTIAGSLALAPQAVSELRATIAASPHPDWITLAGEVPDDRLDELFAQADVFAMASLHEGYGMALAEAIARGLPVVASSGGAAADTLPDGAAIKVPPGDVAALSLALRRVLGDAALRRRMADEAWAAAVRLPDWGSTARRVADVLKDV